MNRTILALLTGSMFRSYVVDPASGAVADPAAAAAAAASAAAAAAPAAPKPEEARTFLTEFGHSADALKGMKDEDVVKLHGTVSQRLSKEKPPAKDDAAAQAAAAAAKASEVKVTLPEKSLLTKEDGDRIAAYAKEQKLDQKAVDMLIRTENEATTRFLTKQMNEHNNNIKKWQETVKTDPVLGGDKLVETQRIAGLAIDRFVKTNPELATLMREGGYGDHPAVVKLWVAIGTAMGEDKGLQGKGPGSGEKKTAEQILYGTPVSK